MVKVKTLKLYLSGIKSYQLDLGIDCRAFLDPHVERTIQGIKRDYHESDRRTRTPLTSPYLLKLLNHLRSPTYNNVVLRAAFTLAFPAFLRVGEFTYKAADQALGPSFRNWFLTKASVSVLGDGTHMQLILPSSKTDPFRKGIKLIIAATNDLRCPVYAMQEFLTIV